MDVIATGIPEVRIIKPRRFGDHRGFFSETYNSRTFAEAGIDRPFVQDNQSRSAAKGTVRGLHFQSPPFAQDKLIRVVRGSILDVAVDIRRDSPTFGRHVSVVLNVEEWNQLYIPAGFAHGFCTLEPDTEVLYKVTNFYSSDHDHGLLWNDPDLQIEWPVSLSDAVLSEKDQKHPRLKDLPAYF
ncbi:MAG: dTDP-4-dehydrorhamnose 3,5-epimerase [Telmatospirillum sp.]|nr:dTDP-4-dehydrorhamnose 3,5-epimerase [Telmatospirillum sp.]